MGESDAPANPAFSPGLEHGASTKGPYVGPGWPDWLLAFGTAALIATQLQVRKGADEFESAQHRYFQEPGVMTLQNISLVVDFVLLALILLWIVRSGWKKTLEPAVMGGACAGVALVWLELAIAASLLGHRIYALPELPFRPVANAGILGSTLFGSYLVLKLPQGRSPVLPTWLIKAAYCVGIYCMQLVVYEFARRGA